nr:unknown function [Klebsiella phage vB_Kpn_K50PH164C1]
MIYLHRYRIASGHTYKDRVTVYDDLEKALGQCRVIDGSIQAYAAVEDLEAREQAKDVLLDEVADLIDCMSHRAPGSPRELEPGSPEWDCYKLNRLNIIRNLLDEI